MCASTYSTFHFFCFFLFIYAPCILRCDFAKLKLRLRAMNCLVLMIYPVLRNDLRLGKKYEMSITFLMTALVNFLTNTGLKVSYNLFI